MKLKHFSLILFLLLTTSTIHSQKQRKIYTVTIFKWLKNENVELKQFIKVDSTGNVFLSNKSTGKKVNLKSFTKSINEFITDKSVVKVAGSDDPPSVASVPKNGEQNVYITVTFLDDFHKETQLATITSYKCRKEKLNVAEKDYVIYSYLEKKDSNILKTILE
jgi:hypothetical protein